MAFTPNNPIIGRSSATREQCITYISARPHGEYTAADIVLIVNAYFAICESVNVDAALAIAQCLYETGGLTSALSQRRDRDGNDLRNPAGIGVTGANRKTPAPGYVWDADRSCYRACVGFRSWLPGNFRVWEPSNHYICSIEAHAGRLLAFAIRNEQANSLQLAEIDGALSVRPLAFHLRGRAPTLAGLNRRWNSPTAVGTFYVDNIARIVKAIQGVRV